MNVMKVGVGIPVRTWPQLDSLSGAEMAEFAVAADQLGFDSAWAIDHFAVDGFNSTLDNIAGPDPLVFLSFVAARTRRIELGTLVLCAPFRLPGQLARDAVALGELSEGRFILNVGSGSRKEEMAAMGLPTDHLFSRFEEYVDILDRLMRGERIDKDGVYYRASGLQALGGRRPTFWLAATGPRSLRQAARLADGWSGARDDFAGQLATLRSEEAAAGRPAGSVVASNRAQFVFADPEEWARLEASHPEFSESVAVGGANELVQLADQLRAAGCQHLVLHFAGARWSTYSPRQLELAAKVLPRLRGD
jgi:alkanesulfonate monooxygenase SsuD/methylene tetrahydromethanopterin reductase-like flavin-dependent oxidoreductase (luciferase family)